MAAVVAVGLVLVVGPLVALGAFVRPASDDWCMIPLGRDGGFTAVVADYYLKQNGRLGNGAVAALVFVEYPLFSKLVPGLVLLGLVVVLAALAACALGTVLRTPRAAARVTGAALSLSLVLVLLLGKPRRYQTLYHAPTIVSHTVPLLVAAALAVLTVVAVRRRGRQAGAALAFTGGVFLGTFNEALTAACLVTVAVLLAGRRLLPAAPPGVSLAAGAGLLAGFLLVYVSPGSRNRREVFMDPSMSLTDPGLWAAAAGNWWTVVAHVFTSREVALLFGVAAAAGVLVVRVPGALRGRRGWGAAVALPLLWAPVASLTAAFVLSYAFNGGLLGRERTWPSITFPLLLAGGWVTLWASAVAATSVAERYPGGVLDGGGVLARRSGRPGAVTRAGVVVLPAVAVAAALAPPAWAMALDVRDLTAMSVTRAENWDRHDVAVRKAVAGGARSVAITPVPIDGLYEPYYPKPSNPFPTTCLPDYYGVDSVRPAPVRR